MSPTAQTRPTTPPRPRWYAYEEADDNGSWTRRWCFTAKSDDQAELYAARNAVCNRPYRVVYTGPRRPF